VDEEFERFAVLRVAMLRLHGATFATFIPLRSFLPRKESDMASEDRAAGKVKQAKGKMNEIGGAVKGDTGQEIKGKIQKGVGKIQSKLGKNK